MTRLCAICSSPILPHLHEGRAHHAARITCGRKCGRAQAALTMSHPEFKPKQMDKTRWTELEPFPADVRFDSLALAAFPGPTLSRPVSYVPGASSAQEAAL